MIKEEDEIRLYEERYKRMGSLRDNKDYNDMRSSLLNKIGEVNAIANTQGKGRSDLKLEVLRKAEDLKGVSKALTKIAENI